MGILERLTSDEGDTIDVSDPDDIAEFLTTGGIPERDNVATGTPPAVGPGGSAVASLGLRTRLAGALGFEAARSDTGQDFLEGAGDVAGGGSAGGTAGAEAGGAFARLLAWVADHGRLVLAGVVVLAVSIAVGQLFTFNVGVGD